MLPWNLDEVLSHTAVLIKRHIDYEFFGVMLLDETGSYLSHRFAVGYPPGLAENLRVPLGQGITGTAISTGQPVRVGDVSQDPRYINAIDSVRSELAVAASLSREGRWRPRYPKPPPELFHQGSAANCILAGQPPGCSD